MTAFAVCIVPGPAAAGQRGAGPAPTPPSQGSAPRAALLDSSEILVMESGGIAGRVHAVKLVAADGRISVEYRAREVPASAAPFSGTLESEPYIALWRELEAARISDIQSPAPTRGADLMQLEVRMRLGESTRVVRWDDAREQTPEIRILAGIARRVLAAGREAAFTR